MYTAKALHNKQNLLAETDNYLAPFTSLSPYGLCGGPSQFGGRISARDSSVEPRDSPNIRHNLFTGTETLSFSIYEPIAIRVLWGTVPHLGEEV